MSMGYCTAKSTGGAMVIEESSLEQENKETDVINRKK